MALFKIEKGLAINLEANRPYTKEGYAYFTTDDGKLYIDISGDGTTPVQIGKDRICLNAANADTADYAIKAKYNEAGYMPNSVSYTNESSDGVKIGTLNIDGGAFEILYPAPLRISYVASEGQTEFDIPFDFPSINSLTVYHNGVLLEMNKHYTISKADKKLTLNGYSCLSGDNFTIMGINGSANISTGIQYLDDTRILFTDRKNLMLDNSGITMGSNYVPNNDYDVVIKSYVDNLYDQGSMKLYKPQPITIGNTTKEFDGSDGLAWSLEEIGAAAAVHSHKYLPLTGGILTGDLSVPNNIINAKKLVSEYLEGTAEYANRLQNAHTFTIGDTGKDFDGTADVSWTLAELGVDGNYLKLTGGALTGSLTLNNDPTEALQASTKQYVDNNLKKYLPLTGGEITGELSASKFLGDLIGTADAAKEANKLATACSLTIGNTSKNFDGSAGLTWTLSEIGAAAASHVQAYTSFQCTTYTSDTATMGVTPAAVKKAFTMFTATNATNATNVNIADDTSSKLYVLGATTTGNTRIYRESSVYMSDNVLYGAAWNDYAEYRKATINKPGKCIVEKGDDTLIQSTARLQPGAAIISDTFGFAIGETNNCKTPIAVSGRVLAYPYESREEFKKNIGRPVCSGPNGTVSIMTDEEYKERGYLAIGTISAVPDYEKWGTGNVKVNGRVWIKIL